MNAHDRGMILLSVGGLSFVTIGCYLLFGAGGALVALGSAMLFVWWKV